MARVNVLLCKSTSRQVICLDCMAGSGWMGATLGAFSSFSTYGKVDNYKSDLEYKHQMIPRHERPTEN